LRRKELMCVEKLDQEEGKIRGAFLPAGCIISLTLI
jgi:hypothetical protein